MPQNSEFTACGEVLVVDDDPDVRELFLAGLQLPGAHGLAALRAAKQLNVVLARIRDRQALELENRQLAKQIGGQGASG